MKKISIIIFLFISITTTAQDILQLEDCYKLVTTNYPLAKQNELLAKQSTLNIEAIKTEKLPSIDFAGQATYQSEVIEFPFSLPNTTVEPLNKDQYKATITMNQLIYAGGLIETNAELNAITTKTKQKQIDVNIHQVKLLINQLYFSILLLQEKEALLTAKLNQLKVKIKEVKAGIKYGTLLPASDQILEAEILKIKQLITENNLNRASLISTLSSLIGKEIPSSVNFKKPEINIDITSEITRPELEVFALQKQQITKTEQLTKKQKSPKLIGFAQGGYGNPGLNMLDNSFQPYYIIGVKLNWNILDWNANKKRRQSLKINKDIVDTEVEVFTLNTSIELDKHLSEIEKITQFIDDDRTIIDLRKKVLKATDSQLKNGVITSSTYISELTNLYEAKNNLNTHKIQLLLAKANYLLLKGK